MTPDQHARQSALNPECSFIVQAPAGSGKTELLVQRFLALLGRAEQAPEEIIAITFTRKAALEMRQRILEALNAAKNTPPNEPHALKTWQLACTALSRDQQYKWHLLENPSRLRVLTIDALCASIARQAPLLSGLGVFNHLLEREVGEYYLEATRSLLAALEDDSTLSEKLALLLLHLDNRVEILEALLVRMLARRDQWLPHLISHGKSLSHSAFREMLEAALYDVVQEILIHCDHAIPTAHRNELLQLLKFSAAYLQEENLEIAVTIDDLVQFPEPTPENKSVWISLAQMLLTKDFTWRLRVDKRQGFPPEEKAIKQRIQTLLQQLRGNELLRERLTALLKSPPIKYTESQWDIISALTELLPRLVAELKVLFNKENASDFSEVALSASAALGDKEYPTDLNLMLDTQIRHLLVDEFQDTSITQFHLLEKLTAGWQTGDGRTLFLVGDPMQSIYRFREAEVGLFLKAQQEGLGSITLEPLILQANFRSTPNLIAWINTQFSNIFPTQSNISAGAVVFSPCIATKESDKESGAFLHTFFEEEKSSTAQKLVDIVKKEQSLNPQQTTAILVRSRGHLKEIIPALKKAKLHFTAVEIDPLYEQSIVQDLLALTGALSHLGDRLSWLSVLRSPWCGLSLHDLHAIAANHARKPLWEILCEFEKISSLSIDARQRLGYIVPIFKHVLSERGRLPYRIWIEKTWELLNGPACVSSVEELNSAEAYFKLLDTFDCTGEIPDITKLHKIIKTQYATPPSTLNSRLHVMTIHKAKGLEFDTVIIPHLELKNRTDGDQLLLWLDRPRSFKENDLILAPIKAKNQKDDPIYLWLRDIEKEKSHHELTRLLYVAATRAKKNLHLIATLPEKDKDNALKKPDAWSFLGLLWECFSSVAEKMSMHTAEVIDFSERPEHKPTVLRRLKTNAYQAYIAPLSQPASNVHFQQTDQTAKNIGTVIHEILEQITCEGLALWTPQRILKEQSHWRTLLSQAGIFQSALSLSVDKVSAAIQYTLNDPRGRWILTNHTEHRSEYALTAIVDGSPAHYVIDRTFVDEHDIRWIIDYKTGISLDTEDVNTFLAQAKATHCEQLEKYAQIMQKWDKRSIRLGIYFPAFGGWCEWDAVCNDFPQKTYKIIL